MFIFGDDDSGIYLSLNLFVGLHIHTKRVKFNKRPITLNVVIEILKGIKEGIY
jgi:hypothetical protein